MGFLNTITKAMSVKAFTSSHMQFSFVTDTYISFFGDLAANIVLAKKVETKRRETIPY